MSASLVGSEMCIRDRLKLGKPVLSPLADRSDDSRRQVTHTLVADSTCEAVSYTHLTLPTICSV
eukprot:11397397-Alexandrium_andersonii.AAC.1